eukprot:1815959-Pyramimonas_sp.AAC.1
MKSHQKSSSSSPQLLRRLLNPDASSSYIHKSPLILLDWLPGSHAEDYVMSAEMKAVKPLEGGVKSTTTASRKEVTRAVKYSSRRLTIQGEAAGYRLRTARMTGGTSKAGLKQ